MSAVHFDQLIVKPVSCGVLWRHFS